MVIQKLIQPTLMKKAGHGLDKGEMIMNINGKEYRFSEFKVTIPSSAPSLIEIIFNCTENIGGSPVYTNYTISLSGEDALQYYLGLNFHTKMYEKLCSSLGISSSNIPQDIESEIPAQRVKSQTLKFLENLYCDFLQNEWTPKLRSIGFIASDAEITVQNTDSSTNIGYLLALKTMDKNEYNYYAGEFSRLKGMIESEGGIMANVERHS